MDQSGTLDSRDHVKLSDIIDNKIFTCLERHMLTVRVVWKSAFPRPEEKLQLCNIVFADDKRHIVGYFRVDDRILDGNIYQKLEQDAVVTIRNFMILRGVEPKQALLKGSTVMLKLSSKVAHISNAFNEEIQKRFLRHLPFNFVPIADIANVPNSGVIDIFGYARSESELLSKAERAILVNGQKQTIALSNIRSEVKGKGFVQDIMSHGKSINQITAKQKVYALMNVTVGENHRVLLLQATDRTIAIKMEEAEGKENLHLIPEEYRDQVKDLLPKPNKKRRSLSNSKEDANCAWNNSKRPNVGGIGTDVGVSTVSNQSESASYNDLELKKVKDDGSGKAQWDDTEPKASPVGDDGNQIVPTGKLESTREDNSLQNSQEGREIVEAATQIEANMLYL